MEMTMETQTGEGVVSIILDGQITFENIGPIKACLAEALDDWRVELIEFDLRRVEFIDSAGLAAVVSPRRFRFAPRPVRILVEPGSQPDRVIRLARFNLVAEVVTDADREES